MAKRKKLTTDFNEQVKLEVGGEFQGRYIGVREITTDLGPSKLYSFTVGEGAAAKEIDIWGTGQLNQFMIKVKPGQMTFIKRVEDQPSPNFPATKMKCYEVEIEE